MKKRILSFALAAVMVLLAVPMLAFSTAAEETEILRSTWDESDPNCLSVNIVRNDITLDLMPMYIWRNAAGEDLPIDGYENGSHEKNEYTVIFDDCYAVVNPALYAAGILTEGMTDDERWDAYGNYYKTCGYITYGSEWTVGNMVAGEFLLVDSRCCVYGAILYNVRQNTSASQIFPTIYNEGGSAFVSPKENADSYYEEYVELAKTMVQPGADGKILWTEIKDSFEQTRVRDYQWIPGSGGMQAFPSVQNVNNYTNIYALRPDTYNPVSLRYTVPENTYGTATLDFGTTLEFYPKTDKIEAQGVFAIALNGEIVWPVGATYEDKSGWSKIGETTSLSKINEALAAVPMNVRAGDTIDIFVARDGSGKISLDFKPTVSLEKKYLVEFVDKDDNPMFDTMVVPGAAMPAAPVASKNGFFINGATEAVSELPATVNGNMTVKYAGEFDIAEVAVEKSNVAVSTDFKVTLYLKGDEYAQAVGFATDDGLEVEGILGEDGLYKVTIPGIAAKDLDTDINLYLFQEFAGGVDATNEEAYVLNPLNLLKTYTTDEAYADVKPLAEAAIDYAAAAKAYFNGEELDAETAARLAGFDEEIAALSKEIDVSGSGVYNIARATLVLTNKVAIKIGVETEDCVTLEDSDLAMTVRVGDEEYTGFTIQQGSEYVAMVITLGGVGAADFDEVQEITIIDGMKRKSGTLSYSVNTYIARTFEGGAGETDNLLRALYALGAAANA